MFVNATIAFDQVVHNTLFIVGHFHQMAHEGIGFAIIAATYAWLPEFTGKKLYSDGLAKWHIWLTFWCQMFGSALWMAQGMLGGPRRWAILPDTYVSLSQAAVPFMPPHVFDRGPHRDHDQRAEQRDRDYQATGGRAGRGVDAWHCGRVQAIGTGRCRVGR